MFADILIESFRIVERAIVVCMAQKGSCTSMSCYEKVDMALRDVLSTTKLQLVCRWCSEAVGCSIGKSNRSRFSYHGVQLVGMVEL